MVKLLRLIGVMIAVFPTTAFPQRAFHQHSQPLNLKLRSLPTLSKSQPNTQAALSLALVPIPRTAATLTPLRGKRMPPHLYEKALHQCPRVFSTSVPSVPPQCQRKSSLPLWIAERARAICFQMMTLVARRMTSNRSKVHSYGVIGCVPMVLRHGIVVR